MNFGTPKGEEPGDGTPVRYDVGLVIVHPTRDPAALTDALGLSPVRATRAGKRFEGETRWLYSRRFTTKSRYFVKRVAELVHRLALHKAFFHELRQSGGTAAIVVKFLGEGYLGDSIPLELLAGLVDLKLDLDIETFTVRQTSRADIKDGPNPSAGPARS